MKKLLILAALAIALHAQTLEPSPSNAGTGGGGGGSGTGDAAAPVTTACSGASATFTATSNTFNKFTCTLVATNVTSSTLASLTTGQSFSITWIQPAGGGITFAAITGVTGMGTIDGSANASCTQPFVADSATTAHQAGAMTCTGGTPGYCFNNSSSGTTCLHGPATGTNVSTLPSGTVNLAYTVASGTASLGTSAISANSCATAVTVSATGVATTDVIVFSPNADISGVTGYAAGGTLTIRQYPSADNVNFLVCNADPTNPVTPGAVTLNWRVAR